MSARGLSVPFVRGDVGTFFCAIGSGAGVAIGSRTTLLALNAPIGHAVGVVSHPAAHQPTSTARIEAELNALVANGKRSQSNGSGFSSH